MSKRPLPIIRADEWRSAIAEAMRRPEPVRDWSLGFAVKEWQRLLPEELSTHVQSTKRQLDTRVECGTFIATRRGGGRTPTLYRLKDDALWSKHWPAMAEVLKARRDE